MTNVAESPRTDLRFTQVPVDQKLYLCAGRDVKTVSGTFALRGYVKETLLGPRGQWKKFPTEVRDAKEQALRQREERRLVAAFDNAANAIAEFLATCETEGLKPKLQTLKIRWRNGETDLVVIPKALPSLWPTFVTKNDTGNWRLKSGAR